MGTVTRMTAVMGAEVRIEVLGPCRVLRGGEEVEFTRQDWRVLTALAHLCHGGAIVDSEVVEEHAWRRLPSPRALRSTVYRVRKALGDDVIITRRRSLGLGAVATDLDDFLQAASATRGVPDPCVIEAALGLVRGVPFADLADHPAWAPARETWTDRIDAVRDQRAAALIAVGDVTEAIALTRVQLAGNPLAISRWHRLVQLLASIGRPVDASRAVEEARRTLAAVGMELPPTLRHAATDIVVGPSALVSESGWSPMPTSPASAGEHRVHQLLQMLALLGEPVAVGRLAELLDISPAAVDEVTASGVVDGAFEIQHQSIVLVDRKRAESALRELSPSPRRELARRLLASEAWADPRRTPFVRLRLALAAGDVAVDECFLRFLDEVGPERDTPLTFIEFLDDVEKGPAINQVSPGVRAVLVGRRAMALRELGRVDEGRAVGDAAYRVAVRTGDADVVGEVLRLSRYPSTESVTDEGAHFGALARVWRPSATTPQSAALVEGLLAYHELARGPVANGIARGRRALAMCAELDDATLRSKIIPMLTYELLWDRSFVPEAEEFTRSRRAAGAIIGALGGQSYVLGARMRRREITFDDAGVTELELLGLDGGLWTMLPSLLMSVCRGILRGDRAPVDRMVDAHLSDGAPITNLATRVFEVHLRQLSTPHWETLAAHELVGDPRRWDVRNPVDAALFHAAEAVARGAVDEARSQLALLTEPLLDATPSVLVVSRLPLVALTARALGDAEVASTLLELNMAAAGLDLCLLPAVHFGPSESWLAMLADVAQAPSAAALHEAAAARLQQLDARVLELA